MITITNDSLFKSISQLAKEQERLENRILSAGGNVVRNAIRKLVRQSIKGSTKSNSDYKDKLIDAVRKSKPHDGEIKVHIMGTQSKGSGTYRLRFYEYPTKRYQTTKNGKKKFAGSLAKYNGFFQQGWNDGKSDCESKMQEAYDKYIEKAWNG